MRRLCLLRARRSGILDHQFDAFASLPACPPQVTRDVQSLPLAPQENLFELGARNAKGARFEATTVGSVQRAADMGVLNGANAAHAMRGENEAWLGVAYSIGTGAVDQVHELEIRPARRQRSIEGELLEPGGAQHRCGEAIVQEFEQFLLLSPVELEAGGHGMPAALEEKTLMHGISDDGAKIH